MSEEKIKGVWWRPEAPDYKLQGEATYGPASGATVDLFGHVYEQFDDRKLATRFTLHGLTLRNKAITLFDCVIAKSHMHMPGGMSCLIESSFGIVGGHFLQPSDIKFRNVYVLLNGLRDWTWTSGIQTKYEEEPRRVIYTYTVPDDVSLGTFDGLTAKLQFSATGSPGGGSLSLKEDCELAIKSGMLAPYTAFAKVFHTFQHFLSLALQRPSYALQVIGNIDTPREVIQEQNIYEDFLIVRELSKRQWDRETLIPQDLLFTLPELEQTLEEVVQRFFAEHERLKPAMDLYMSTVYNPDQLLRAKFLTLAQSVEAYHRVSMSGKYVDDEVYNNGLKKILWDAIPSGIDAGFRDSLKNKLKYLHEFSLRKRIEALAQKHATIVGELLGRPEELASSVSELRNQLTHPEPSTTLAESDYKSLWHLSERMALLLEVCFLDELGFRKDRIKEIVSSRSQRARRVHYGSL